MGIVFGKTGVVEPIYETLLSKSACQVPYELRRYGVRYACETEMAASESNGKGFMALAGYIGVNTAPQNDGNVNIAMTAPVATEKSSGGGTPIAMTAPVITDQVGNKKKMQFILPAEYDSMDKIPKPTSSRVSIKEIPGATGAVHTFGGSCNDKKAEETAKKLIHQLKEDGVDVNEKEAMDKYSLWQFHPPFTIPLFRRNEIWIELNEAQVQGATKN